MKISIEYCVVWNYFPKASSLKAEIEKKFSDANVTLIKGQDGVFEVVKDGNLIFSKKKLGRFPDHKEIFSKLWVGAHYIQVLRGVEDIKAYRAGQNNRTNAFDLMLVMEAIANKRFVSTEACEQMNQVLLEQKFKEKIPAQLPESVKVAHKTGSITKIDHDCAIVYPPNSPPYILVILTKGIEEQKQVMKLMADISKFGINSIICLFSN